MNKKLTVGASVTSEIKERIQRVAKNKHWSVGQTLGLFIERYWDDWERELGIAEETAPTPKKHRSPKSTTK